METLEEKNPQLKKLAVGFVAVLITLVAVAGINLYY